MSRYYSILFWFYVIAGNSQSVSLHLGDTLYLEPETPFEVALQVEGFRSIVAFQMSLQWDTSAIGFESITEERLPGMINRIDGSVLAIVWTSSDGQGMNLADSTTLLKVKFRTKAEYTVSSHILFIDNPLPIQFYTINNQLITTTSVIEDTLNVITRKCNVEMTMDSEQQLCQGDSLLLTVDCQSCLSIQWEDNRGGFEQWVDTTGIFIIKGLGENQCQVKDSFVVQSLTPTQVEMVDSLQVCPGETELIEVKPNDGVAYHWSNGDTGETLAVTDPGLYYLTVTDQEGCQIFDSIYVHSFSPTLARLFTESDTICQGDTIFLWYEGPSIFSWEIPGTDIVEIVGPQASVVPEKSSIYSLAYSDGCVDSTLTIGIHVQQIDSQVKGDTLIRLGQTAKLMAAGGDQWFWTGTNILSPVRERGITVKPSKSSTYVVQVCDQFQCCLDSYFRVHVQPIKQVFTPNIISPNGDGINDTFTIYGGPELKSIHRLSIYDRWGNQVYEAREFPPNENGFGWTARFRNKTNQASLYVYEAEVIFQDNTKQLLRGEITVLR